AASHVLDAAAAGAQLATTTGTLLAGGGRAADALAGVTHVHVIGQRIRPPEELLGVHPLPASTTVGDDELVVVDAGDGDPVGLLTVLTEDLDGRAGTVGELLLDDAQHAVGGHRGRLALGGSSAQGGGLEGLVVGATPGEGRLHGLHLVRDGAVADLLATEEIPAEDVEPALAGDDLTVLAHLALGHRRLQEGHGQQALGQAAIVGVLIGE